MKPRSPKEGILIDATPQECPYLENETAVLPLRWYPERIEPEVFDGLLEKSDRRVGRTLYRPSCPSCSSCEGIRVRMAEFQPSSSQRKLLRKNSDLQTTLGPPRVDSTRLDLFNRHKLERDLSEEPTSGEHYANWLATSCVDTLEVDYWLDDKLIGVSILDFGAISASSVYFFFDPDESSRGLGTFSVLHEIEWLRSRGLQFYYLGLWIGECASMSYKSRFLPHERLISGEWKSFSRD